LVVNSTTTIFIMLVIALLVLVKIILTHPHPRTKALATLGLVMLGALGGITFTQPGGVGSEFRSVTSSQIDYLRQSLDHGSFLGPGVLASFDPGDPRGGAQRGLLSWFAVLFHVSILGILGMRMLLSRSSWWYLGGAILYLAGHSMKAFGHTATSGYHSYMLVVLALTLACFWQTARPEGAARSPHGGSRGLVYRHTDPGTKLPC
jgi:hypothetical protein